jgi:hypothetical protein
MRTRTVAIFLAAMASLGLMAPAHASTAASDIAIQFTGEIKQPSAPANSYIAGFLRWDYGPAESTVGGGYLKLEIEAPRGTVFGEQTERQLLQGQGLGNCVTFVPHKHVRCEVTGFLWISSYACDPGKWCPIKETFDFLKVGKCFGPGRVTYIYPYDPKPSNNSARIPGPKSSDSCTPKPSPSPSKRLPSPSTSPSASPSPSDSAMPSDLPTLAEATPAQVPSVEDASSGPSVGSLAVYGGGAVLLSLGGGVFWWMRKRRPEDFEAHEDE